MRTTVSMTRASLRAGTITLSSGPSASGGKSARLGERRASRRNARNGAAQGSAGRSSRMVNEEGPYETRDTTARAASMASSWRSISAESAADWGTPFRPRSPATSASV